MKPKHGMSTEGFGSLHSITEGYVVKGGFKKEPTLTTRPPAPKPSPEAKKSQIHQSLISKPK